MRKKLENMTVKEIEKDLESNEAKRQKVLEDWIPLNKKLDACYNKDRKLREQIKKIKCSRKRIDWDWLLSCNHQETSEAKHTLRGQALRKLNLGTRGFFHEIEQTQVRVALVKNDPKSLPATMKGLNKILKYLKPVKGNYKMIDIFDHTLSEHGCYCLLINEEKEKYKIQITRYHREETLHCFNNLKEALALIQKKYYYEDADAEDSRW